MKEETFIKIAILICFMFISMACFGLNCKIDNLESELNKTNQEIKTDIEKLQQQTEPAEKTEEITDETYLLARVIHSEANNQPIQGQVAVGAVVMNRISSSEFPNNLEKVIFAPGQFDGVRTHYFNDEPTEKNLQAAKLALQGQDPTNGAIYFYNPKIAKCEWIKTRPIKAEIQNHVFAG